MAVWSRTALLAKFYENNLDRAVSHIGSSVTEQRGKPVC